MPQLPLEEAHGLLLREAETQQAIDATAYAEEDEEDE